MLGERVKQKEKHTIEKQMSTGTYTVNQYFTWKIVKLTIFIYNKIYNMPEKGNFQKMYMGMEDAV